MYDSRFAVGPLSPSLQIQLAQIYRVSVQEEEDVDKILTVKVPAVQQQTGKVDYGILAIAFAYHAASGDNPADLQFQQERMRDHLLQCFKKKQLSPFPHMVLAKQRKQDVFPYHEIEVFYDCNIPEVYDDMVQCEECED